MGGTAIDLCSQACQCEGTLEASISPEKITHLLDLRSLKSFELQKYLLQFLPKHGDCAWKFKPDGDYGIDVALIDKNTGKKLLCVDLERWSAWKNEWPSYYRYLHFLGRKDHFLEEPEQFLMVFFEYNRNKLIILDKETIKKYPTKRKWFAYKQLHDDVKEMKMSDGHIFGTNITERERKNFR